MGRVAQSIIPCCPLVAAANAAPPTLDLKLVADNLSNVTCITLAGDGSGRLFTVEQAGRIKIFDGTKVLPTPFLNVENLVLFSGE